MPITSFFLRCHVFRACDADMLITLMLFSLCVCLRYYVANQHGAIYMLFFVCFYAAYFSLYAYVIIFADSFDDAYYVAYAITLLMPPPPRF